MAKGKSVHRKDEGEHRRKKAKNLSDNYRDNLSKILKRVHPELSFADDGRAAVNNLGVTVLDKLLCTINILIESSDSHKKTMSTKDISCAISICLPGELSKHAISMGLKAMAKYKSTVESRKGRSGDEKIRKSVAAGLMVDVGKVARYIRSHVVAERVSAFAPVYLAAVLEYIFEEIIYLAGNATEHLKKKQITPRAVMLSIKGDEEMDNLFHNSIIGGGVLPHIHPSLMKKEKKSSHEE